MHDIVQLIIFIVLLVLVLSFFGVSLPSLAHQSITQSNFDYVWQLAQTGWQYLVNAFNMLIGHIQAAHQ